MDPTTGHGANAVRSRLRQSRRFASAGYRDDKSRPAAYEVWSGEEQGALGSLAYAKTHIAAVARATTAGATAVPEFLRRRAGLFVFNAEHAFPAKGSTRPTSPG